MAANANAQRKYSEFKFGRKTYAFFSLPKLAEDLILDLNRLPFSIRILLENVLRNSSSQPDIIEGLAKWNPESFGNTFPFFPGRVLLQDLTGVPLIADLASMRDEIKKQGGDPSVINPVIPVDLVVDHSIQVDFAGNSAAFDNNNKLEFERNQERYQFLHWAQSAFRNLRIIPPAAGIVHQINVEYLSSVLLSNQGSAFNYLFPDTVIGTDSHTTMSNGLGVLSWGVGGIEAIAGMLGEPVEVPIPPVIGINLFGVLQEGTMPTDLTLTITQRLRNYGVVNKFVEFFGTGMETLSVADRVMISNMAPEYGATVSYFPVDHQTLDYLRLTNRSDSQIDLIERYYTTQSLFRNSDSPTPQYTDIIDINLSEIEPSLAGPTRPQDRIPLWQMPENFNNYLTQSKPSHMEAPSTEESNIEHGSVVIAAITSCTNTSNPFALVGAALLAKKAVGKRLTIKPYVKTSFAPGSRVVTMYLEKAGLMKYLETLGFHLVGYGCTTCIGNSGPLEREIESQIVERDLVTAAVLSGNRNFEARVHPLVKANYLASPALVVAYALAGNVNLDLSSAPIGISQNGKKVYLQDVWPTSEEINKVILDNIEPSLFKKNYASITQSSQDWEHITGNNQALFAWNPISTYIQPSPFVSVNSHIDHLNDIKNSRALVVLGDSVTTDHISPASLIPVNSPAGKYLLQSGVKIPQFNSYGARRGNPNIMVRGTFANIRLRNKLSSGYEGGITRLADEGRQMDIYDAANIFQDEGIPLLILAGKEYGTGSSRDWAAKGPLMLGVKAVLAESYERIHRSNLIMLGILPLKFQDGESLNSLALTGFEQFSIFGIDKISPFNKLVKIRAVSATGTATSFPANVLISNEKEFEYLIYGGILPYLISKYQKIYSTKK